MNDKKVLLMYSGGLDSSFQYMLKMCAHDKNNIEWK